MVAAAAVSVSNASCRLVKVVKVWLQDSMKLLSILACTLLGAGWGAKLRGQGVREINFADFVQKAEALVKAGQGVTPEEKEIFESVEKTILETTLPSLSEAAKKSQQLLDTAFAGVGVCNAEFATEKAKATAAKEEALAKNSAHEKLLEDIASTAQQVTKLSEALGSWMSANAAPEGALKSQPASAELAVTASCFILMSSEA